MAKVCIDMSILPADIMNLRDQQFWEFVQETTGKTEAELLKLQEINNVRSLLLTANVFSFMELKTKNLTDIKAKFGFELEDGTFAIKAGIKGNIGYLIELLQKKQIEIKKETNLQTVAIPSSTRTTTNDAAPATASTNISISSSSLSSANTVPSDSIADPQWTLADHKKYIIDSIGTWCDATKRSLKLEDLLLNDGQHYHLKITDDMLNGSIVCNCNQTIKLTQRLGKYQLSNFYRHLKALNSCSMMTNIYNKNNISSATLPLNQVSNTSSTVPSTSTQSQAQTLPAAAENINSTSLPTYTQQTNDSTRSSVINRSSKRLITSSQIDETSSATKRVCRN
jgi:hypothetical protein